MKFVCRILAVLAFLPASGSLWALDIVPGQGVSFSQVSYPGVAGGSNTSIGMIEVDLNVLRNRTGLASGYLNAATTQGWVVRNLPVIAEKLYPYSHISMDFDLGAPAGTAVSQLTAALQYTAELTTSFSATPGTIFSVAARQLSIGGADGTVGDGPTNPAPPDYTDILFPNPADNVVVSQRDHPNLDAANSQCGPMAIANSLQYLKDTQSLPVPHEHKIGLGKAGDLTSNTLVGQLDLLAERPITDRKHGKGIKSSLIPKLTYLAKNNLANRVATIHWGYFGADRPYWLDDASVTVNGVTATSKSQGGNLQNIDELIQALNEGQDCEMTLAQDVLWGHAVDIVAAGKLNGQPFLVHASDLVQSDEDPNDNKGAGPAGFKFEYLKLNRSTGYLETGERIEVAQVICEKVIPPPVTEKVTRTIDPLGHSCCVDPPPSVVNIFRTPPASTDSSPVAGTTMTVSGAASWLPLTGPISADGAFSLSGRGTVAGFSNVSSSFVGMASNTAYTGTITVGTNGALPGGLPIAWDVTIDIPAAPATPAIRVNGFRHDFSAAASDLLRLSLSMQAGVQAGQSGDWWLVSVNPDGVYHFDLATMTWQSGLAATYTGPLFDIPYFALPYSSLPRGATDVYFGFDNIPNGALDMPTATYEVLRVIVP